MYVFRNSYTELLYCLVLKELKVRYNYNFFGYLWALGNPIAFAIIYYFAFKVILRIEMENYSVFLLTGMFPWIFISNSIVRATMAYRSNITLVKRVKIPLSVLPMSTVFQEAIHFIFSIPVLIIFIYFSLDNIYLSWLYQIPILIIFQILFLYSISQILAVINVFIRDVEYLTNIFVNMTFFLTPIIYPISLVPEKYNFIFLLSPFTQIITNWRSVLMDGSLNIYSLFTFFVISMILTLLSYYTLQKYKFKMSEAI